MDRQFRFAYFTPRYDETISFYERGLGLALVHSWDRSPDDRGTLVRAGIGLIEVLALPSGPSDHLFDSRPPQGAFMVIEVDDVDALYRRAKAEKLPIQQELADRPWGHRCFCVCEPSGLTLYLFNSLENNRW